MYLFILDCNMVIEEGTYSTPFRVRTDADGNRYALCVRLEQVDQYVFGQALRRLNLSGATCVLFFSWTLI